MRVAPSRRGPRKNRRSTRQSTIWRRQSTAVGTPAGRRAWTCTPPTRPNDADAADCRRRASTAAESGARCWRRPAVARGRVSENAAVAWRMPACPCASRATARTASVPAPARLASDRQFDPAMRRYRCAPPTRSDSRAPGAARDPVDMRATTDPPAAPPTGCRAGHATRRRGACLRQCAMTMAGARISAAATLSAKTTTRTIHRRDGADCGHRGSRGIGLGTVVSVVRGVPGNSERLSAPARCSAAASRTAPNTARDICHRARHRRLVAARTWWGAPQPRAVGQSSRDCSPHQRISGRAGPADDVDVPEYRHLSDAESPTRTGCPAPPPALGRRCEWSSARK
eukprot:ctg_2770.g523